jgi:hypothetical protein
MQVKFIDMETIDIEIEIDRKVEITVHLSDVIGGINELSIKKRWNYITQILNEIEVNSSELTEEQKRKVKEFLTKKLALFER